MAKATACGQRVLEVLEEVHEIRDLPGAITLSRAEGCIALRNVTMGYGDDTPVLGEPHENAPEQSRFAEFPGAADRARIRRAAS